MYNNYSTPSPQTRKVERVRKNLFSYNFAQLMQNIGTITINYVLMKALKCKPSAHVQLLACMAGCLGHNYLIMGAIINTHAHR